MRAAMASAHVRERVAHMGGAVHAHAAVTADRGETGTAAAHAAKVRPAAATAAAHVRRRRHHLSPAQADRWRGRSTERKRAWHLPARLWLRTALGCSQRQLGLFSDTASQISFRDFGCQTVTPKDGPSCKENARLLPAVVPGANRKGCLVARVAADGPPRASLDRVSR